MRTETQSPQGLRVRAIAGTYVVLLAWNCDAAYCEGLLGFGILRTDHTNDERMWLRGLKKFDLPQSDEGDSVTTRRHPIQKFHWGDYTTKAGRRYTYEVHAMRGTAADLASADSATLEVMCEHPDHVGTNGHAVHFNRSAAASQAFAQRFASLPPGEVTDPAARTWLSRGLEEALVAFIDQAQPGEGLHLFLYEFDKREFARALKAAQSRGVRLEILHDAILDRNGKGPSVKADPLLVEFGLDAVARGRNGAGIGISHNKFMVRTDVDGVPRAVWTGSTNFSDAAIYAQSNVGHAIVGVEPATTYFTWHQTVWNHPDLTVSKTRTQAMALSPLPVASAASTGTSVVFSPRETVGAISLCASLILSAEKMVCFTAPFALHDAIEAALIGAPAQVFGLLNKRGVVEPALYAAPNTSLAAAGALNDRSVLEAWQDKMLREVRAESLHHSGVFIHTKLILVDPLSDQPRVITGSANFSNNSSRNNDENQLFIFTETAVADVYIGEFMRMFDHYYYRDHVKAAKAEAVADPRAVFLDPTDGWTRRYFGGGEREAQRLAFF